MEKLVVLGTGNASARRNYNTCFVLDDGQGNLLLVDGGGGNRIFDQLDGAGVSLAAIRNAVLSHAHTDHLLGMLWVLRAVADMMRRGVYEGEFTLYCHAELARLVNAFTAMSFDTGARSLFGARIFVREVVDGETLDIAGHNVTFFDLNSTKLPQFGFALSLHAGRRLVFSGDEPLCPAACALVHGADWLLAEAFCLSGEAEYFRPYEKHHSTVADACRLAQSLDVKNLVLWHTEDTHGPQRRQLYEAEGRRFFSGNLFVPDDLETICLSGKVRR